jgi:predicted homoserine dehydrogenase-like protein
MIIDTALQQGETTSRPIPVGMVGAGATGRAIALQLGTPAPGIRQVVANRTPAQGERASRGRVLRNGAVPSKPKRRYRGDSRCSLYPSVLTARDAIDLLVEVTGTIQEAARVAQDAFEHGKHVVLVNAERTKPALSSPTRMEADREWPSPLLRYFRTLGLGPWPPLTSRVRSTTIEHPKRRRHLPRRMTRTPGRSLRLQDAAKLSMDTTVLANATGFHGGRRGM